MSQMDEGTFRIAAEKKAEALEAIKALAGGETIKDSSGRHFSWVRTEAFVNADTLEEALYEWRWSPTGDPATGDIIELEFRGEKLGDDAKLFEAIAPFVDAGSFIQMLGEDGEAWRWYFDGSTCVEKTGALVFD